MSNCVYFKITSRSQKPSRRLQQAARNYLSLTILFIGNSAITLPKTP